MGDPGAAAGKRLQGVAEAQRDLAEVALVGVGLVLGCLRITEVIGSWPLGFMVTWEPAWKGPSSRTQSIEVSQLAHWSDWQAARHAH